MEHKVTPKIRVRCEASLVKLVARRKKIKLQNKKNQSITQKLLGEKKMSEKK